MSSNKVKKLDKKSIGKIHSEQIVKTVTSGIKELLENSIDSGADRISIFLKDYGIEYFSVLDNGCGIGKNDLPKVINRGTTSKLKENDFLMNQCDSLGFRVLQKGRSFIWFSNFI